MDKLIHNRVKRIKFKIKDGGKNQCYFKKPLWQNHQGKWTI